MRDQSTARISDDVPIRRSEVWNSLLLYQAWDRAICCNQGCHDRSSNPAQKVLLKTCSEGVSGAHTPEWTNLELSAGPAERKSNGYSFEPDLLFLILVPLLDRSQGARSTALV